MAISLCPFHSEADQSLLETLEREFIEEIGTSPKMLSSWHDLDFDVFKNSEGENIEFRHTSKVCI